MASDDEQSETAGVHGEQKPQNKPASTQKKKWSSKKKIITVVSAIAVVIILIVATANSATQAPLKVSNELVADIQAKNSSAAYSLFSSDAKAAVNASDFGSVVNQIGPILTGKPKLISKEVFGETGKAATAKVVYEIKGTDNNTYVFTVNLTKDNGQWKAVNFDSKKK